MFVPPTLIVQLVTLADEQEAAQVATREAAQALAAGVRLLLLLAR